MSSTLKTSNLNLNNWVPTDIPKMQDFNRDNSIIDSVVGSHNANQDIHITDSERLKWNSMFHIFTYNGNGSSSRTVSTGAPFEPTWGIVFAKNTFPSVTDFTNTSDYNYFAIVSNMGSMTGVTLNGSSLQVVQTSVPVAGSEYRNFNETGVTYVCIMFR